jgi:small conductance mechanosensitive channel
VNSTLSSESPLALVAVPRQPSPSADCTDARELCEQIYQWTGWDWLASGSYYLLIKPLRIILIVLLAVLVRFLVHRLISRIARSAATPGPGIAALRPLRSRLPSPPVNNGVAERRRARAEALGSILRSIASAVVFGVGFMLVLDELGVNLAPILAGAGILGLAIGFGAQNLVRDFLSGLFMLFEDQYGVGDLVGIGDVEGNVEAVGLRITTVRDLTGTVWYIRNGEIQKLANKSQGWALVMVDIPVGFTNVEDAVEVLKRAAVEWAESEDWRADVIEAPEVVGVEEVTTDGAVVRTTVKTPAEAQWRAGRELRRRLTEALAAAGIANRIAEAGVHVQPTTDGSGPADPPTPAAAPAPAAAAPNPNAVQSAISTAIQRHVDPPVNP